MERMTLVAVVLCALLLTTVGTGMAIAKQEATKPQNNYQFDVTYEGKVVGKLGINTNTHTFAFHGTGLTAGTTYYLICNEKARSLGSTDATKAGIVQIKGTWDPALIAGLKATPTFELHTSPPVGAGCIATVLDAKFTDHVFWKTISGTLATQAGAGVPGQEIEFMQFTPSATYFVGTTTTHNDGTFQFVSWFWKAKASEVAARYWGNDIYCYAYDGDLVH